MKRRRKPRYDLSAIKAAFSDPARLNRTIAAAKGARDIGFDERAVVDLIAALTPRDFEKSMPSYIDPVVWQDVYKPAVEDFELYVKFTLDPRGILILISFKENDE